MLYPENTWSLIDIVPIGKIMKNILPIQKYWKYGF